jgi:hypothetical protein
MKSVPLKDPALIDAFRRLDSFGSIRMAKSPTGQAGPGWFAADIADSWSEELFGTVVTSTPVEVTVAAGELTAALTTNPDFLAAVAKAVNDDAAQRLES